MLHFSLSNFCIVQIEQKEAQTRKHNTLFLK